MTGLDDQGDECACEVPDLYVVTEDGDGFDVEPSSTPGPTAALYRARCVSCGRHYSRPFRRTHRDPS